MVFFYYNYLDIVQVYLFQLNLLYQLSFLILYNFGTYLFFQEFLL
ncbi:hypothetical protein SAMN02745938_101239 [Flavobacterium psychrophilum DSM 3660]|nr:hypothetical protein SAMN02745938_101239 [Flavobacterium psychrophilum DSM 3660] [Flavobacterium psychrophilum DSM 3660 = ATCC 49418]